MGSTGRPHPVIGKCDMTSWLHDYYDDVDNGRVDELTAQRDPRSRHICVACSTTEMLIPGFEDDSKFLEWT